MRVRDCMHPKPVIVRPDTPLMEAEWRMEEGRFRHLPVVAPDGRLLGIVSDRDLRAAAPSDATSLTRHELAYLLSRLTVADVMSKPVHTARPDEPADEAALRMREHRVGALPVVEGDAVVGIVTTTDMLDALAALLQERATAASAEASD